MKDSVILTRHEKNFLLAIKAGFAFVWGFINTVTIIQSDTFATMMTGNCILLGMQTTAWEVEKMELTAVLIVTYILGSTTYEALSIVFKEKKNICLYCLVSAVLIVGVLADVLQHVMQSCSDIDDKTICEGRYLYYLVPVSFMTGMVGSGYWMYNPDKETTHMFTDHVLVAPHALLRIYLVEGGTEKEHDDLVFKACTSIVMISMFFLGVIVGDYGEDIVTMQYLKGSFVPIYTAVAISLATGCGLHFTFYERCHTFHSLDDSCNNPKTLDCIDESFNTATTVECSGDSEGSEGSN